MSERPADMDMVYMNGERTEKSGYGVRWATAMVLVFVHGSGFTPASHRQASCS